MVPPVSWMERGEAVLAAGVTTELLSFFLLSAVGAFLRPLDGEPISTLAAVAFTPKDKHAQLRRRAVTRLGMRKQGAGDFMNLGVRGVIITRPTCTLQEAAKRLPYARHQSNGFLFEITIHSEKCSVKEFLTFLKRLLVKVITLCF